MGRKYQQRTYLLKKFSDIQKVLQIEYGKVNNHAKMLSGGFNCHLNNEDKQMVKIPMRIPIVGHQEIKMEAVKSPVIQSYEQSQNPEPRPTTSHKDEEPRNMLVRFKVIQTLG